LTNTAHHWLEFVDLYVTHKGLHIMSR